ncbi:DNA helicase Pif1 like protein, partial [Epithele typhae]|uniref:DNA helicase Pif1 like protein n=1 Tax=Epithele typhae TaxID=378194 RepID=UPI0020075F44
LNAEQHGIYTEVMDAVEGNRPLCAFVDGKAGRGKTFLVNTICSKLRSQGHVVLPTATSAFAAQLYAGGKTTHSVFKVSLRL